MPISITQFCMVFLESLFENHPLGGFYRDANLQRLIWIHFFFLSCFMYKSMEKHNFSGFLFRHFMFSEQKWLVSLVTRCIITIMFIIFEDSFENHSPGLGISHHQRIHFYTNFLFCFVLFLFCFFNFSSTFDQHLYKQ